MMLVLLQNAWSGYWAGKVWPRDEWLDALWSCRTGRTLANKILKDIPEDQYWVDNTTPVCGEHPSSLVKPDLEHVRRLLLDHEITTVLACGKQAGEVVDKVWRGSHVKIPHPACRWVGNKITKYCNEQVVDMIYWDNSRVVTRRSVVTDAEGGIAIGSAWRCPLLARMPLIIPAAQP